MLNDVKHPGIQIRGFFTALRMAGGGTREEMKQILLPLCGIRMTSREGEALPYKPRMPVPPRRDRRLKSAFLQIPQLL